jgi:hypothetical protein
MHLEASTKPPIYNLIHEFLINMAYTMACPNFKKDMKMAFGPLGVNVLHWRCSYSVHCTITKRYPEDISQWLSFIVVPENEKVKHIHIHIPSHCCTPHLQN